MKNINKKERSLEPKQLETTLSYLLEENGVRVRWASAHTNRYFDFYQYFNCRTTQPYASESNVQITTEKTYCLLLEAKHVKSDPKKTLTELWFDQGLDMEKKDMTTQWDKDISFLHTVIVLKSVESVSYFPSSCQ